MSCLLQLQLGCLAPLPAGWPRQTRLALGCHSLWRYANNCCLQLLAGDCLLNIAEHACRIHFTALLLLLLLRLSRLGDSVSMVFAAGATEAERWSTVVYEAIGIR